MTKWHFPLEAKALYEFMGDVDDREAAVNSDAWGVKPQFSNTLTATRNNI